MCQTTINQSTVIANISVCIAGSRVSYMYELNGVVQEPVTMSIVPLGFFIVDHHLNYDEENKCTVSPFDFLEDNKEYVVRLWLIEKYK